jgi:hypothetical protein
MVGLGAQPYFSPLRLSSDIFRAARAYFIERKDEAISLFPKMKPLACGAETPLRSKWSGHGITLTQKRKEILRVDSHVDVA